MGLVTNAITSFAKSKTGVRFYKWADSEKGASFLDNTLPTLESVATTVAYTYATERQNLDRRRKNILHIQNIAPAIVGIGVGSWLNRKAYAFGNKIIENVKPEKVKDAHKVVNAVKIALPIFTTALLMRLTLPVITAFASGKWAEKHHGEEKHGKKLDLKA